MKPFLKIGQALDKQVESYMIRCLERGTWGNVLFEISLHGVLAIVLLFCFLFEAFAFGFLPLLFRPAPLRDQSGYCHGFQCGSR